MIKRLIARQLKRFNRQIVHDPTIKNAQLSVIVPAESWKTGPNKQLLEISLKAAAQAVDVSHADIAAKMIEFPHWPEMWPGEHYKLLSALVQVIEPMIVVEIGTATGYSALSMKKFLKPNARIYSFDIVPWKEFPNCILQEQDFADGRLIQVIDDLSVKTIFDKHTSILSQADFIFIDAAKDGVQEQVFINHFSSLNFSSKPIFMFDDIRMMNMIDIWNNLEKPKLDLTFFGHWSGTGLVDWTGTK